MRRQVDKVADIIGMPPGPVAKEMMFRSELIEAIHTAVKEQLEQNRQYTGHIETQLLVEAFGFHLGWALGEGILLAVPKKQRDKLLRESIALGKRYAMVQHGQICDGCEASEQLIREIRVV